MAGNELNKGYIGIDRLKTTQGIISSRNIYLDAVQPQISLAGLSATFVADFTTGTLPSQISFLRSTDATFLGSSGYLTTAGVNVPRFQFDSNGNTLGLLIQSAIANRHTYSSGFTYGSWGFSNMVTTPATAYFGITLAPDGTNTASKIVPTASYVRHNISTFRGGSNQALAPVTQHVFLKKGEYEIVRLIVNDTTTGSGFAFYANLTTGKIYDNTSLLKPTISSSSTVYVGYDIQKYAADWYKVSIMYAVPYTKNTSFVVEPVPNETFSGWTLDSSGFVVMSGNGSSGFYAWGGFYEGTNPILNHIETQASAVAQGAEYCGITIGVTGWFAQPGSFYVEYYGRDLNNFSSIQNGFVAETPTILGTNQNGYGSISTTIIPKGTGINHGLNWYDGCISSSAGTTGLNKAVFTYSGFSSGGITQSVLKYSLNGIMVTSGVTTFFNPSLVSQVTIGHMSATSNTYRMNHLNGIIRKVLFYQTVLTDDQMKEITKP